MRSPSPPGHRLTRAQATSDRVLRCLPHAGSGESIRAHEIASRLGISGSVVTAALARAVKSGRAVRLRPGDFCLALEASR